MSRLALCLGLLALLNACGLKPASDFETASSCDDQSGDCSQEQWDDTPGLCKLYGKEEAFLNCLSTADPRQQTSLKAMLKSKDQTGEWSSDYFYSDDFSSRYHFSDTEAQCLESVLCDQSSNGN